MDTSETFIKMCEKAREVQALYGQKLKEIGGTQTTISSHNGVCDNFSVSTEGDFCTAEDLKKTIWLPRQDQLQEIIVGLNGAPLIMLIGLFENFTFRTGYGLNRKDERRVPPIYIFKTMEQLWLAFCMSEKFNKYWDGGDWIEEDK